MLRNYSNYNVNKYKEGVLAEEEQCDDLIVCFELLENLTTKDFFDFSSPPGIHTYSMVAYLQCIHVAVVRSSVANQSGLYYRFGSYCFSLCGMFITAIVVV